MSRVTSLGLQAMHCTLKQQYTKGYAKFSVQVFYVKYFNNGIKAVTTHCRIVTFNSAKGYDMIKN